MTTPLKDKLVEHSAIPIFPTLIWASQVENELAARINRAFIETLEQARQKNPDLKPMGKWQSDQRLHTVPELAEFCDLVYESANHILDSESIRYEGVEITGCWANIGFPGSRHRPHGHPNNYLSGVYYVKAPKGGNTINFIDPRAQASVMLPPSERMSAFTAQKVTIDVRDGTMVIFPSWLTHSVDVNQASEERISIAFNLMFKSYVEDMSAPLWEGNLKVTSD